MYKLYYKHSAEQFGSAEFESNKAGQNYLLQMNTILGGDFLDIKEASTSKNEFFVLRDPEFGFVAFKFQRWEFSQKLREAATFASRAEAAEWIDFSDSDSLECCVIEKYVLANEEC